ncbi:hypothetical protein C8A00DRAFT_30817 [Chaetomidium leptoderma]|uniref:DUF7735 domain-containing protein n=1 Tax=Chaetomidium leptoderma TaxID=669021 RepID=A0AAN6ZZA4_9PEZI|nr:hypothetical protein C8A00DRAFT_30817 [Chaetomidium leptoderma]
MNPPKPSGSLDKALISYGSQLIETCRTSGTFSLPCPFPDKTRWCGATTALPASLLPDYSSYASSASSWWSVHSSSAVRIAQECPILWYEASNFGVLGGNINLNLTLIDGECYAEANPTSGSAAGPTATQGQGATDGTRTPTATRGVDPVLIQPQPTRTRTDPNGVAGRAESGQMWAVAASGLAAVLANAVL